MQKTKSLQNIEAKLLETDPSSFRYKVLDAARQFKNSWMQLGQYLFTVYKDKRFKEWGYLTFEAYCAKEIGIKQPTAMKLLRSYSFLEREEPAFLKRSVTEDKSPGEIPSYEAVNALRLAKTSDRVPESEYRALRDDVLENAREEGEVKKKLRFILKAHAPKLTPEEKEEKKETVLRRLLITLRGVKTELQDNSFPAKVVKPIDAAIDLLEEMQ